MTRSPRAIEMSLDEFILAADLPGDTLRRLVEEGILHPHANTAGDWRFEMQMIFRARRAVRLQRDLEIDWSGIALAIELLDELEQLRDENRILRRRLGRFTER